MHVFFSGIGGTGIGPLAMIASQAGLIVSGSDKRDSQYIKYLKKHGISDIHIGQTAQDLEKYHQKNPIDWYVYSSAVEKENPNHPELLAAQKNINRVSKRDELINHLIELKGLKLIAVAGTHGKTTTTAMLVYLIKKLGIPISYSVGAKMSFGDMGQFDPGSQYFALEADEFDHNFLSFSPYLSLISGVAHDHHEQYPTQEDYNQAFRRFLSQSQYKIVWKSDFIKLGLKDDYRMTILDDADSHLDDIELIGHVNRQNAWLVINTVANIFDIDIDKLISTINDFPGVSRRMEKLAPGLYSDYAHTVEKIAGAVDIASEIAKKSQKKLILIYEPLTNRRMHYTAKDHEGLFKKVDKLYWVPSYLAREDPDMAILTPGELIRHLSPDEITKAVASSLDEDLRRNIMNHLDSGDMVVALSGGGGESLDEWLRNNFVKEDK